MLQNCTVQRTTVRAPGNTTDALAAASMDRELLHGVPAEELARLTGVHVTTARRWKRGAPLEPPVARLLSLLLTGDLGAISPAWRGWRLVDGKLYGPDLVDGFTPGDVLSIPYLRSQVAAYQSRLRFAVQADWVACSYTEPDQHQLPAARTA